MLPWNTPPELTDTVTTQVTPPAFKRFWGRDHEVTSVSVAYYIEEPIVEWQDTGAAFRLKVVRSVKPVEIRRRAFRMALPDDFFPGSDE